MASDQHADLIEKLVAGKAKAPDEVTQHIVEQVKRINAESAELARAINEIDARRPVMVGRLHGYHAEHAQHVEMLRLKLTIEKKRKR